MVRKHRTIRRLARNTEYAAEMMRDHRAASACSGAALPSDAALRGVDYARHAPPDGVAIMTSYATPPATWPGDASLAPVFAELNRRKAAAFFHLGSVGYRGCIAVMLFPACRMCNWRRRTK
jgi:hypothetical protein